MAGSNAVRWVPGLAYAAGATGRGRSVDLPFLSRVPTAVFTQGSVRNAAEDGKMTTGPALAFVFVAGLVTALATGLGALPFFLFGDISDRWNVALWGLASGIMLAASGFGLISEGLAASTGFPALLVAGGVAGVGWSASLLGGRLLVESVEQLRDVRTGLPAPMRANRRDQCPSLFGAQMAVPSVVDDEPRRRDDLRAL